MPNLGNVSVLNINGNELTIKDSALTGIVNEIVEAIGQNNEDISQHINDLNDKSFDGLIKIGGSSQQTLDNVQNGLYKVQYVHTSNEEDVVDTSKILIQNNNIQLLIDHNSITTRSKTNNTWSNWLSIIPEQVQANWNEGSTASPAYIQNKPSIPDDSNLVHKTGNETISGNKTFNDNIYTNRHSLIEHHIPELITGNTLEFDWISIHADLTEENLTLQQALDARNNVQADWNEGSTASAAYIKNKPTIPTVPTTSTTVTENDTNPVSGGAVYSKFEDLIGSAPAALDTLQEIAAALNNDADLAGTLTTQISQKIPKVTGATAGNFAALASDGTLVDSGHKHSDYVTSVNGATGDVTIVFPVTSVNGMTGAVVIENELSSSYETSTDKNDDLLLSSGDTYEEAFGKLEKAIIDNELIATSSLNDLNNKISNIPTQVQSNWKESSTASPAYIKNKPSLSTVATSGSYNDLSNKPIMVNSFNGATGDVTYEAPVTSVNGMTGAVTIDNVLSNDYVMTSDSDDIDLEAGDTFEEAFGKLEKRIEDNELISANTLADLNVRLNNINIPEVPVASVNGMTGAVTINTGVLSFNGATGDITYEAPVTSVNGMTGAITIDTALSNDYAMSSDLNEDLELESGDTFEEAFGKLEKAIIDNELTISSSLSDLNTRLNNSDNNILSLINRVVYSSTNKTITFYHDTTIISTIDATDFIKDGMVNNVTIDTPSTGINADKDCLIISFNTDAGTSPIEIPLENIFNPDNYYTKQESGNAKIFYGTCSTASGTATKLVTCPEFTAADFVKGALIFVTFTYTNTAAVTDLQLNVNSTGAKPLKKIRNGGIGDITDINELTGNVTYLFTYQGNNWICMTLDYNTNTTYSLISTSELNAGTSNTARLISALRIRTSYYISNQVIHMGNQSITVPLVELSANYERPELTNEDLLLEEGDTYEEAFGKLEKNIIDNEKYISNALNDLNTKITNIDNNPKDLLLSDNYAPSTSSNANLFLKAGDTYEKAFGKLEKLINDNEYVITNAFNNIKSSLSSDYSLSTLTNEDLLLEEGDTYEEAFGKLEKSIIEDEEITASALSYLNEKVDDLYEYALSELSDGALPTVTSSDNGKILQVVNGSWTLVSPSQVYSGSGLPDNTQGNNGDLYIQTE